LKIVRTVDSFLNNGINTPIGMYPVGNENIVVGTLVGFDANGLLVSVEKVENKDFRAVGVITEGSTTTALDARYLPNGKNFKEAGDFQNLYRQFKIMGVANVEGLTVANKWEKKDIGTVVYLVDGKLTVAVPVAGAKYQKIGVLGCPFRKEILCDLREGIQTK
jgi:hypothetical protein